MTASPAPASRRSAILFLTATALFPFADAGAEEPALVTVHKDPTCGCCGGWVAHLQKAGFATNVIETRDLNPLKKRLGVPEELAACHTAEMAGYVIEGHVPAPALRRLLQEKPMATGLAVPGMPAGSPGMEGGSAERYDVILFGPTGRRTYMSFVADRSI
jgi:hypothetical protein